MGTRKSREQCGGGSYFSDPAVCCCWWRSHCNCQDCPPVFTGENPTHQPEKRFVNDVVSDQVDAKNAMNPGKGAGMYCFFLHRDASLWFTSIRAKRFVWCVSVYASNKRTSMRPSQRLNGPRWSRSCRRKEKLWSGKRRRWGTGQLKHAFQTSMGQTGTNLKSHKYQDYFR